MNQDVTLLDILIDGFEKNEILLGFHWRSLPLPNEAEAIRRFAALVEEARRWKGGAVALPGSRHHDPGASTELRSLVA